MITLRSTHADKMQAFKVGYDDVQAYTIIARLRRG